MKTCKVCGSLVEDREWNCPECGASMITSGGSLSLKAEEQKKKRTNPMGTTVSTGSGLTDILRAEDDYGEDDNPVYGSIPVSFSKTIIEEEEARKKAKANHRLIASIFKTIFLLALVVAIVVIAVKVSEKEKGASTYKEAVKIYVEAVNNSNTDKMLLIMPNFLTSKKTTAKELLEKYEGVEFTNYSIKSAEPISENALLKLTETIKLENGKNANRSDGYVVEVEFTGSVDGGEVITTVAVMEIYRDNGSWYLYPETYSNPLFEN